MRKEYAVQGEVFQGPLSVLLELIEKQELVISDVSLGSITEDFLRHIEQVEHIAPHEVADFLLVAGRLLYLKSKLLLPGLTMEEDEEVDLAGQLKLYQRFAEAAAVIADRAASQRVAYNGPRAKIEVPEFSPPTLTGEALAEAVFNLTERVRPYVDLPEKMLQRTVTVEEKIEQLKARIQKEATTYFHDLTQRGSRADVVTSFLALLELLKQDILRVEQKGHFDDIAITRV